MTLFGQHILLADALVKARHGWLGFALGLLVGSGAAATGQDATPSGQTNLVATNVVEDPFEPDDIATNAVTNALPAAIDSLGPSTLRQTNPPLGATQAPPRGASSRPNFPFGPGRDRGDRRFPRPDQAGPSTNAPAPGRLDYTSFRIITDRNIFNPNRRRDRGRGGGEERAAPRVDWFSLVGTMSYEKGNFAFFDGSGFQYRKVLQPEASIAGYKILEVTQNSAKLSAGTNQIELRIGAQMRREDEGEWSLANRFGDAGMASTSGATSSSSGTETNATSGAESAASDTASSAASGADSDILKKLMQRREKEMNK